MTKMDIFVDACNFEVGGVLELKDREYSINDRLVSQVFLSSFNYLLLIAINHFKRLSLR